MPNNIRRAVLTKTQLRATEIMLYRMADLIDRLLADNKIPYTKMEVAQQPQFGQPQTFGGMQGGA